MQEWNENKDGNKCGSKDSFEHERNISVYISEYIIRIRAVAASHKLTVERISFPGGFDNHGNFTSCGMCGENAKKCGTNEIK